MNSPKTEEIVKSLRDCSADEMDCKNCVAEWGRKYGYCFNMLRLYAADRLEKLEAEVSRLKAQQRWIPVTERLPEECKNVLIATTEGVSVGCYDAFEDEWFDCVNVYNDVVTHWMTLPEPPKEG